MIVGKLVDNIWATRKSDQLRGYKLMLAEVMDRKEKRQMVVIDIIGAGIGDRVVICEGSSARRMLGSDDIPVDAVVIGIIDADCVFTCVGEDE